MITVLPFFLKYLLAPFLLLIVTFIMGQVSTVKVKVKSAIIFILCFALLIVVSCLFAFLNNEFVWFGLLFTILYYLILGVSLLFFMDTNFFKSIGVLESLLGKFFIFLLITILSAWLYYLLFNLITISGYVHIIMLNILWVFVPFLFSELKKTYLYIPEPFYAYWRVGKDRDNNEYWDNMDKFKLMQVSIKIRKRTDSEFFSKFDVKIAQEISLGSWFNKFIEDQNYRFPNNAIETNENDENMGWVFYTSKYFQFPLFIRTLDPKIPILRSNIKNKQIIYAKRVLLSSYENQDLTENI